MRTALVLIAVAALAAGCISSPEQTPGTASLPDGGAEALVPKTEKVDGFTDVSAATPVRTVSLGGVPHVISPKEGVTGYIVEVEWTPSSPASQQMSVWVRLAGAGDATNPETYVNSVEPIAKVDGPSPIRVELPIELFTEEGEYEVFVRASAAPAGVVYQQAFTSYLTTFDGVPYDAAFTALEASESA